MNTKNLRFKLINLVQLFENIFIVNMNVLLYILNIHMYILYKIAKYKVSLTMIFS